MRSPETTERRRFGIVAVDPLRLLGFQTLFPEGGATDLVPLLPPHAASLRGLSLVLIDATCTDHLLELISTLRKAGPGLPLIVVGLETSLAYIESIIGAGVKGYLTHAASEVDILQAVAIVLDGSVWAPRKVLARLIERGLSRAGQAHARPRLTPRERDVLRLLVQGSSNKEIGAALAIDPPAVKAHVGRLLRKVGVPNRTALGVEVLKHHLLDRAEPAGPSPAIPDFTKSL